MKAEGEPKRCPWPGTDPLYVAYHDDEWGVPEWDDRALYEKLVLDGFQAGLSWITILRKREAFRSAFDNFQPDKVARYTPKKIEALMRDEGIVRNRMKIEGAILSARAWLATMENGEGFSRLLWGYVGGKPLDNRHKSIKDIPAETELSRAISKRSRIEAKIDRLRELEDYVFDFYAKRPRDFFILVLCHAAFHFAGAMEIYLTLRLMGLGVDVGAAFTFETVNRAINMAFVFVPALVGVDEAGTGALVKAAGFDFDHGVTLALIRKIRMFFWIGIGLVFLALARKGGGAES